MGPSGTYRLRAQGSAFLGERRQPSWKAGKGYEPGDTHPPSSMEGLDFSVRLRSVLRVQAPLLILSSAFTLLSYEGVKAPYLGLDFGLFSFAVSLPILLKQTWQAAKDRQVNAESTMLVSAVGAMALRQYSAAFCPSVFLGYTVSLDLPQRKFRISVTRIEGGGADEH